MRKRNAIIVGSAFLLITAGYVAWCWRPFYLSVIKYHHEVPHEVATLAENWSNGFGLRPPLQFRPDLALYMLAHPWENFGRHVDVYVDHPAPDLMDIRIEDRISLSTYRYVRIDGKWLDERNVR